MPIQTRLRSETKGPKTTLNMISFFGFAGFAIDYSSPCLFFPTAADVWSDVSVKHNPATA